MAKPSKIVLIRPLNCDWCYFCIQVDTINQATPSFCWSKFAKVCPGITRRLRPGQQRELILRQTKRGISLYWPPASRKKKRGQDANITKKEGKCVSGVEPYTGAQRR